MKRHRLGVGIAAAAVAVVVVSGLTAWGVGTAVAASYESAASATVPPVASVPPAAPATGEGATARGAVVRGTIASISGSTWTITTLAGETKQVTIGSATHFGTKKVPAVAADFTVGTVVLVTERSSGDGETAVRVIMAKQGAHAQTAAPTTTS